MSEHAEPKKDDGKTDPFKKTYNKYPTGTLRNALLTSLMDMRGAKPADAPKDANPVDKPTTPAPATVEDKTKIEDAKKDEKKVEGDKPVESAKKKEGGH